VAKGAPRRAKHDRARVWLQQTASLLRRRSLGWALSRTWDHLRRGDLSGLSSRLRRLAEPPAGAKLAARYDADSDRAFVPLSDTPFRWPAASRVIAFYLPQFHPIPENDQWWGPGFTEWTNVRPARPLFTGHHQPHVPIDPGYYDLRDTAVQRRQIELAKLYGIGGFCFYFYWFGGKRLLEKPLENWLESRDLDFPFCLCWANENWSRRWDGLDSEILIAQRHSPEDDVAFIREVAPYLRDPRYIRVDGKPLLLIYRPSLLPNAVETAGRWRAWCAENGLGEVFLAYTQSFERADPRTYGFDAAVEFPPNNAGLPDATPLVKPVRGRLQGRVFDWSALVRQSEDYGARSYPLFRAVNPGWDNTARRGRRAMVLVNNSPPLYRRWLQNAILETVGAAAPDRRLVFVNAWNEWAEGAHLEPDAANGYAYLQATRDALRSTSRAAEGSMTRPPRTAVAIHAYYTEIFDELLDRLRALPDDCRIFATTDEAHRQEVHARLVQSGRSFVLRVMENRGRDVLPFLTVFPEIAREGFDLVLKVHTKRSLHRGDGDGWRRELYESLIDPEAFRRATQRFAEDPTLGMIGPDRHYVAMSTYIGANENRILSIGHRLGLNEAEVRQQGFFAGTMFMARVSALEPVVALGFPAEAFEPEAGQIDGTLAHALERGFALSVAAAGMRLVSTADLFSDAVINDRYGFA
jgi:lipopolysaccharide biosynthesis protein